MKTGCSKGEDIFILRIPLITSQVPFQFKCLRFQVGLNFAMSINKISGPNFLSCGFTIIGEKLFFSLSVEC